MTIAAEVICDSATDGRIWKPIRLTTLRLRYPRFIHAEFMTHRVFSRNASSSRAIPVEKLIQDVLRDPVNPSSWGQNQPGMQAHDEISEHNKSFARAEWEEARKYAVKRAKGLAALGVHKQIVNRLLEPFGHINVLVSSTEWDNFFELRDHPDAQPEIRVLAQEMKKVLAESKPRLTAPGTWHLPYVTADDWVAFEEAQFQKGIQTLEFDWAPLIKISVARCARTSYLTHDGKIPNIEDDLKLYERLVGARPLHASPAEHQATPCDPFSAHDDEMTGNFKDWVQYRKVLEDQLRT